MSSPALPGTKPTRPSYPPPLPSGTPVDPGGQDNATRAFRRQQQVTDLYTRWRSAHSPDIDPDVLKGNAGAFSVSDAALMLPEVLAAVKDDADTATRHATELIQGYRVGKDVASQLSATRYWNRVQRSLDAIKDTPKLVAAAQSLVANAENSETPILSEELGAYLGSRNAPYGWLPDALAHRIPGLAEAQADAILKSRQHAVLAANHQKLQKAMASDTDVPPLLDPANQTSQPYTGG